MLPKTRRLLIMIQQRNTEHFTTISKTSRSPRIAAPRLSERERFWNRLRGDHPLCVWWKETTCTLQRPSVGHAGIFQTKFGKYPASSHSLPLTIQGPPYPQQISYSRTAGPPYPQQISYSRSAEPACTRQISYSRTAAPACTRQISYSRTAEATFPHHKSYSASARLQRVLPFFFAKDVKPPFPQDKFIPPTSRVFLYSLFNQHPDKRKIPFFYKNRFTFYKSWYNTIKAITKDSLLT